MISFDTETQGLSWWDPDEQAFLATWADARGEYHRVLLDAKDRAAFAKMMTKQKFVIAHNMPFDAHQIRETCGIDLLTTGAELHDTNILARVVFPEGQTKGGYKLKDLGTAYLKADAKAEQDAIKAMAKTIGLRALSQHRAFYDIWRAYPDVMEAYARQDARLTYDLFELFNKQLQKDTNAQRVYALERKVQPILIAAEQKGLAIDQAAVQSLTNEWQPIRDQLHEYLVGALGADALEGDGSQDALRDGLLRAGVPLHEKTESGQLSTNKFALQEFAAEHEVIGKLMEYRTAERFLRTYLGPMTDVDVTHTSIEQIGAWTGRMSSRRPNLQNLPKRAGKEVRAMIVPRPGHALVVCDYESIEARLLAYYLGDPGYRALVVERDSHAWMASNIWGGTPERYLKGGPNNKLRDLAKNILFAITYGAGRKRVASMLLDAGLLPPMVVVKGVKQALDKFAWAGSIISKVKKSLPNYYKLNKRIKNKIENVGYVNTYFGRKNPVKRDKAYVGLNALIQGTAADIMKQGVVNIHEANVDTGAQLLLVVHDEALLEVPLANAAECLELTTTAMIEAAPEGLNPGMAVTGSIVTTNYADA